LAKSGRETELSSAMKLITGYLSIMDDKNSSGGTKKDRKHSSKTVLAKYLSHKLTQNPVRQCLVGRSATFNLHPHFV